MKKFIFVIAVVLSFSGFAQVNTSPDSIREMVPFELREPAGYLLDKQEFTFTPEVEETILIKQIQDEQYVDYGKLRRTTPDGYYIMTTTIDDDVSFGRFDSMGNFRALRYDRERDSVIVDYFEFQEVLREETQENRVD